MTTTQPEDLNTTPSERFDETESLLLRAIEHVEQLPKDFTPSTSFLANLKSLNPSSDPYHVSFSEMREFMVNKASQEESSPN